MTTTNNKSADQLLWLLAITVGAIVVTYWLSISGVFTEDGGIVGEVIQVGNDAINSIMRGNRATHAPYDKTTGVVPGSPQSLADQTGYDLETYSLARAISSEEGRSSNLIKTAVGWAIRNHSGGSITPVVTKAKYAPHNGFYGTQRNIESGTPGYNGSDRYCSTANDPYAGDLEIAAGILDGSIADPTNGAAYFDRPAQENADKVAANRAASGLSPVTVDGIDPTELRFWA